MSVYGEVSKRIGHKVKTILYPNLEQAQIACTSALNGDIIAFEEVFDWYRHLPAPTIAAQQEIISYITEQFKTIRKVYEES